MSEILFIILFFVFLTVIYAGWSFAPWVPTWKKDIDRAEKLVDLKKGDIFYDLGCGDGRVVCHFSQKFNCNGKGIEIAIPLYVVAKMRSLFYKDVTIYFKDLFRTNISDAKMIFIFAASRKMSSKLIKKFQKELKPGTMVMSYVFPLEGIEPVKIDKPDRRNAIYLYKF